VEIRSYRTVFDLERRIYRVDRLRLNPGGIPLRGIVYFLALAAATLIAGSLPLLDALVRALPWYMRDVGLPGVSAAVLTMIRIEGRPFHLAALSLLRYASGPRHLAGSRPCRTSECSRRGQRWHPPPILSLPDGSDARFRRMRYTGPGTVLVTAAHQRAEWRIGALGRLARRPDVTLSGLPGKRAPASGQVISLHRDARLRVR
jgi:hypothetical protein